MDENQFRALENLLMLNYLEIQQLKKVLYSHFQIKGKEDLGPDGIEPTIDKELNTLIEQKLPILAKARGEREAGQEAEQKAYHQKQRSR